MKTFHFVPHNGLQRAQEENPRLESQKYLTAARKHVMRGELRFAESLVIKAHSACEDIGISRRRGKRTRTASAKFNLGVVLRPQSPLVTANDNAMQYSEPVYLTLRYAPTGVGGDLPVIMTKRVRSLLDHCILLPMSPGVSTLAI